MSLDEIMHRPTFVGEITTVHEAAKLMAQRSIGSVLVGTPENVRGIFSERDLLVKIAAKGVDYKNAKVKDYMTRPVKAIDVNCSFSDAQNIMIEKHIRRLPVVKGGRVVGVISARSLMEHMKYEYLTRTSGQSPREQYTGYW